MAKKKPNHVSFKSYIGKPAIVRQKRSRAQQIAAGKTAAKLAALASVGNTARR